MHEMEIDEDDDYAPTEDEIRQEEEEEPTMMQNVDAWDDFLAYVALLQSDWATPDEDTVTRTTTAKSGRLSSSTQVSRASRSLD